MDSINSRIANELGVRPQQVAAAVALLDEGSTVPFIARYRKEVTGSLDDTQLRNLEERLRYLRELDERRVSILASIEEQGKLTPELKREIDLADTKTRLEDLYLPYKQKRRTKGQIALEAGLGELADALFGNPDLTPEQEAERFVDAEKGFADVKAVLEGAKYILMERFAEDADLLAKLRDFLKHNATLSARVVPGKEAEGAKFSDYFEHDEVLKNAPSHRALAIFRGRNEGILSVSLKVGDEAPGSMHPGEGMIGERFGIANRGRAADKWLSEVVRWTWKVKLYTHLETDLLGELRDKAEDEAISVFARNLHDLLLAAPAGPRATLALDPGLRTGCKVAVVDATGKLLETATVYPHAPRNDWDGTLAILAKLCAKHAVDLIAIGNGTASRESDKLAGELIKKVPGLKLTKIMVSEAGASVYSASELAAREFPDLDVSLRGCRLHRPPPAGSAGRAGEDRPEIHRSRPVPARRVPAQAGAFAGCRGRGLRERRRRRREYRFRRPAGAHLRAQRHPGAEHRRLPRCQRCVQVAQRAEEGAAPGRQDLRAGRRLPARDER